MTHSFPDAGAPMLAAFGPVLARRVASLICTEPLLAARLALASPRALHATGAFLQSQSYQEWPVAQQAKALLEWDARDLLSHAVPGHDRRLYRLLDRLSFPIWPLETLTELAALVAEEYAELRNCVVVFPPMVEALTALRRDDPAMRQLVRVLGPTGRDMGAREIVGLLRNAGVEPDWQSLPPKAGAPAYAACLMDAVARLPFPPTELPVPPGWRAVGTLAEAKELGQRLANCLSSSRVAAHAARAMGGSAVLLWHEGAQVLIELQREALGCWTDTQCAGLADEGTQDRMREELAENLEATGVVVLKVRLATLLRTIEPGDV